MTGPAAARRRLDALGGDTWRLYIDLDRQHQGAATFDEGLGGRREPGYLASMLDAHAFVTEGIGRPVTLDDYVSLQERVTTHDPPEERWRPSRCWVHVPRAAIEPGLRDLWAAWDVTLDEAAPAVRGHVRVVMARHAGAPERVEDEVKGLLETGQAAIRAAVGETEGVAAVARLHQALELLHPTRDANTRRHLVLLQRLLVDAGRCPCLLTEPNHVYVRSPASWARCLQEGMDRWRWLTHAIERGHDPAAALLGFDVVRRPLGSALGRWHQPVPPPAR